MSQYDGVAARTLAQITKKGAPVTFAGGSAPVYHPATDTWTGGSSQPVSGKAAGSSQPVSGKAVQIPDNPARFAALKLELVNPVTLMVAAKGLEVVPVPGMTMTWANETYTIKDVEPVAPDGTAILYTVTGSR